jgi:hypothetical protein
VGHPEYNGVKLVGNKHYNYYWTTTEQKLLDKYLPQCFHGAIKPDEENGVVSGHKKVTRTGDKVIVAGGGFGVSMVNAAKNRR